MRKSLGRLHRIEESHFLLSWVVGALDSAWRAVYEILWLSHRDKLPEFLLRWGENQEWVPDVQMSDGTGKGGEGEGIEIPGHPGLFGDLFQAHMLFHQKTHANEFEK